MNRLCVFMLLVLFLAGLALGQTPGQTLPLFDQKVVSINVTQPWTPTGIICAAGDTLHITVRGAFSATTTDPGAWCGPDGNGWSSDNTFPVPTAAAYSVIGKVGTSGVGFPVGSNRMLFATAAGELNLGVNDIVNFTDNGGTLVATVIKWNKMVIGSAAANIQKSTAYSLDQNYPNPFNPSTIIEYEVPQQSNVEIRIFNSVGQLVKSLVNDSQPAGTHRAIWDGTDDRGGRVASGNYFYQIRAGEFTQAKQMLLLK